MLNLGIRGIIKCDLLGKPYNLKMMGRENFQSFFGGIISLILMILMITITVTSFIQFGQRGNPKINYSTKINDALKIDFKDNYPLAFVIGDVKGEISPDPEKFLSFLGIIYNINTTSTTNKILNQSITYLGFQKCSKEFIYQNYGELADMFYKYLFNTGVEITSYMCLKPQKNFYISNIFGGSPSQFILFSISPCKNTTNMNYTCFSDDKIKAYLNRFTINMYTPSNYLDTKSFENPVKPFILPLSFTFTSQLLKLKTLMYRSIDYITKSIFFDDSTDKSTYFQFESVETDVHPTSIPMLIQNSLGNIILSMKTNVNEVYERIDITIVELISSLGGSFSTLLFCFSLINQFVERKLKELSIFAICTSSLMKSKNEDRNLKVISNIANNQLLNSTRKYIGKLKENQSKFQDSPKSESKFKTGKAIKLKKNSIIIDIDNDSIKKNFRSFVLDLNDLEDILITKIRFLDLVFGCCLGNEKKLKKIEISTQFCSEMFDLQFLFGWILKTQLMQGEIRNRPRALS